MVTPPRRSVPKDTDSLGEVDLPNDVCRQHGPPATRWCGRGENCCPARNAARGDRSQPKIWCRIVYRLGNRMSGSSTSQFRSFAGPEMALLRVARDTATSRRTAHLPVGASSRSGPRAVGGQGSPPGELAITGRNVRVPQAPEPNSRLILDEENWLPLIRSLDTLSAVTNAVGG